MLQRKDRCTCGVSCTVCATVIHREAALCGMTEAQFSLQGPASDLPGSEISGMCLEFLNLIQ